MYLKKMIEFLTLEKKRKEERFTFMGEFEMAKAQLLKRHHSEKDALCIAELEEMAAHGPSQDLAKQWLFKKIELSQAHDQEDELFWKDKQQRCMELHARARKEKEDFIKTLYTAQCKY